MVAHPPGAPPRSRRPPAALVVAGVAPGAGATTVTAGLAAALRDRGLVVQAFAGGSGEGGKEGRAMEGAAACVGAERGVRGRPPRAAVATRRRPP